ncbi:VOC family protein [Glycomyces sp. NRRL B-16210]|uniref:VOC family protein n=1 Tax=Glycomyces sp. NRRL B-16210 TaxID=1463821 RepID=UPI0004BEC6A2|nr:VOC family protein [Glycomyces sp. NRRL B-16210]
MAVHFKICIDCTDPHRLAAFWAEAMGYAVEDHSPLIEVLLQQGVVGEDAVVEVDGHKAWKTAAAVRDPDAPVNPQNGVGQGMRLLFQVVPEKKTVKNRLHLDLHYGPEDYEAQADRLEGLGATRLGAYDEDGAKWILMADPEGNEFCAHA